MKIKSRKFRPDPYNNSIEKNISSDKNLQIEPFEQNSIVQSARVARQASGSVIQRTPSHYSSTPFRIPDRVRNGDRDEELTPGALDLTR